MREFFHGWRRKLGVSALVMAMALMISWVRARTVSDYLMVRIDNLTMYELISSEAGLGIAQAFDPPPLHGPSIWWISQRNTPQVLPSNYLFDTFDASRWNWFVPHGWTVIPLTVLSACLLLSKPRLKAPQASRPATSGGE